MRKTGAPEEKRAHQKAAAGATAQGRASPLTQKTSIYVKAKKLFLIHCFSVFQNNSFFPDKVQSLKKFNVNFIQSLFLIINSNSLRRISQDSILLTVLRQAPQRIHPSILSILLLAIDCCGHPRGCNIVRLLTFSSCPDDHVWKRSFCFCFS